ncbi:gas vesicle protein GvpH [Haladaptatus sp. NG-SE-30]
MGLIGQLVRLANTLAEEDTPRTRSGRLGSTGGRINYTVSFDSIDSGWSRSRREDRNESRGENRNRQGRTRHRQRYLTDVRKEEDELVVTVDLPDVLEDDLSVKFDDETGIVEVKDEERRIKRLNLDWDDAEMAAARFNNHVLELRFGEIPDG